MLLYFSYTEAGDVAGNVLIFLNNLGLNIVIKRVVTQTKACIHKRRHIEEKPFKCDMCPSALVRQDHLTSNMRSDI